MQDNELYTYEDYSHWEGDWELINGFPVSITHSLIKEHQNLIAMYSYELNKSLISCDNCEVLVEENYIVNKDTILKPDISIVCNEDNEYITKTPELIIEVTNKLTLRRDETIKYGIYEKEGVKYYIITYPDKLTAKVYENNNGFKLLGEFSNENVILPNITCPVEINFENIFKKLKYHKEKK